MSLLLVQLIFNLVNNCFYFIKPNEKLISYIESRFYRAPAALFPKCQFQEIWQLNEIVKVIGPPSEEDLSVFEHDESMPIPSSHLTSLTKFFHNMFLLKSIYYHNYFRGNE